MKKGILFALLFVLLPLVFAQSNLDSFKDNADNLERKIDQINNAVEDDGYLIREWGKILNGTAVGTFFQKTNNIFVYLDPLFNFLLGIGFTWSWKFFLTLVLFLFLIIALFWISYSINSVLENDYSAYFSIAFFGITFFWIRFLEFPLTISNFIIGLFLFINNPLVQMMFFALIILIIILLSIYSRQVKYILLKLKRKRRESLFESVAIISETAKRANVLLEMEKVNKAYSKGLISESERKRLLNKLQSQL